MTDSNIKWKRRKESVVRSESTSNSKDDENLMQNWSLTFTEYATNDQFTGGPEFGKSEDTSEDSVKRFSANQNPDGRGHAFDSSRLPAKKGHPVHMQGISQNGIITDINLSSEKIEVLLPQADQSSEDKLSVSVEGVAMSIGKSRDKNSARARDRNMEGARVKNRERFSGGDGASLKSKRSLGSGRSDSQTEIRSELAREHSINTPKASLSQNQGDLSKHSILPAIGQTSGMVETQNIVRSVRKSQDGFTRRTPPIQNGYGGKVQPIYVRFPGQRTGQMML